MSRLESDAEDEGDTSTLAPLLCESYVHGPGSELTSIKFVSLEQQYSALITICKVLNDAWLSWFPVMLGGEIDKTVNVEIEMNCTPNVMDKLKDALSKNDRIELGDESENGIDVTVRVEAVNSWGPEQPEAWVIGSIIFTGEKRSRSEVFDLAWEVALAVDTATLLGGYVPCSLSIRNISTLLPDRMGVISRNWLDSGGCGGLGSVGLRNRKELIRNAFIDFRWLVITFPVKTEAVLHSRFPDQRHWYTDEILFPKLQKELFEKLLEERHGALLSEAEREQFQFLKDRIDGVRI